MHVVHNRRFVHTAEGRSRHWLKHKSLAWLFVVQKWLLHWVCVHACQAATVNPFRMPALWQATHVTTLIFQHMETRDRLALAAASTACLGLLLRAAAVGAALFAAMCRRATAWVRRSISARMAAQQAA